jgi:hypothetical protein
MSLVPAPRSCATGRRKTFGHVLAMHFGFYLVIAALVIMSVEVVYALYQLANFFL